MTVGRPLGASGGAQWSRQVREKEERNSVCARKGVSKERKLFVIALETETSGACRGEVWD